MPQPTAFNLVGFNGTIHNCGFQLAIPVNGQNVNLDFTLGSVSPGICGGSGPLQKSRGIPLFPNVPACQGVYIVGVWHLGQFCPLYVGKHINLQSRIEEHYRAYLNGRKELFDLTSNPVQDVYEDIYLWNRYWGPKRIQAAVRIPNYLAALRMAAARRGAAAHTVRYFNHAGFYDDFIGYSPPTNCIRYAAGLNHAQTLHLLNGFMAAPGLPAKQLAQARMLLNGIQTMKSHIDQHFTYAFVKYNEIPFLGPPISYGKVETQVKKALEALYGIYTYSHI